MVMLVLVVFLQMSKLNQGGVGSMEAALGWMSSGVGSMEAALGWMSQSYGEGFEGAEILG